MGFFESLPKKGPVKKPLFGCAPQAVIIVAAFMSGLVWALWPIKDMIL